MDIKSIEWNFGNIKTVFFLSFFKLFRNISNWIRQAQKSFQQIPREIQKKHWFNSLLKMKIVLEPRRNEVTGYTSLSHAHLPSNTGIVC